MAASLPAAVRRLPLLGGRISELLDRDLRDRDLAQVFDSLCAVGRALRERAPEARILFVDYLTLLPPAGESAPPLSEADADLGRHVAATLERLTAEAAAATDCEIVRAGAASRDHHAWSAEPWTTRSGVPVPYRPAPLHPNAAGMRAVAELVCGSDVELSRWCATTGRAPRCHHWMPRIRLITFLASVVQMTSAWP